MLLVFGSTPWADFTSATFRLAGFGGAAVYLRSQVLPGCMCDTDQQQFAVDIGLLSPEQRTDYYQRPTEKDLAARLSDFFLAVATNEHPEESVTPFADPALGLTIEVPSSEPDRVCLDVSLVVDPEGDSDDVDELNFETSRAALLDASDQVRHLTFLPPRPAGSVEGE